jgi:hypothetical protein
MDADNEGAAVPRRALTAYPAAFLAGVVLGSVVATLTSYALLVEPESAARVLDVLACYQARLGT